MENKFIQQMKKGVLDMIVLNIIRKKHTYGYELIQKLEREGEGFFDLKEGTLYPVLYRLEDSGFIRASWHTEEGRTAPKKYYEITEEGRTVLEEYRKIWGNLKICVDRLCGEVSK